MIVGQGIFTKIKFKDGNFPKYPRPYLIVNVKSDEMVDVINVSSTEGKEHKLLFPDNYPLSNFKPPFKKHSFVKLDSLCTINLSEIKYSLLHGGECLNEEDLKVIQEKIQ